MTASEIDKERDEAAAQYIAALYRVAKCSHSIEKFVEFVADPLFALAVYRLAESGLSAEQIREAMQNEDMGTQEGGDA